MNGVGYAQRSDDGVIGDSGAPKVVYGFCLVNGAGGNGVITLRDGTTTGGTAVLVHTSTAGANGGQYVSLGGVGVTFPSGCFADVDANVATITVFYREVV